MEHMVLALCALLCALAWLLIHRWYQHPKPKTRENQNLLQVSAVTSAALLYNTKTMVPQSNKVGAHLNVLEDPLASSLPYIAVTHCHAKRGSLTWRLLPAAWPGCSGWVGFFASAGGGGRTIFFLICGGRYTKNVLSSVYSVWSRGPISYRLPPRRL